MNRREDESVIAGRWLTDIKTVPYLHYSSDLAAWDFYLFLNLKENRSRSCFENTEKMKETMKRILETVTLDDIHGAFTKWLDRANKCTEVRESNFEGD